MFVLPEVILQSKIKIVESYFRDHEHVTKPLNNVLQIRTISRAFGIKGIAENLIILMDFIF